MRGQHSARTNTGCHMSPGGRKIRGTAPYWHHVGTELHAMNRGLGPATWFVTLSANDLGWDDLAVVLGCPSGTEEEKAAFLEQLTLWARRRLLKDNQASPPHLLPIACLNASSPGVHRCSCLSMCVHTAESATNCAAADRDGETFPPPVGGIHEIHHRIQGPRRDR